MIGYCLHAPYNINAKLHAWLNLFFICLTKSVSCKSMLYYTTSLHFRTCFPPFESNYLKRLTGFQTCLSILVNLGLPSVGEHRRKATIIPQQTHSAIYIICRGSILNSFTVTNLIHVLLY